MTSPIEPLREPRARVGREQPRGRDETRQRILAAALELFGRDGFENTTVRAIARRCGLTDPALYYYFKTKREILDALWDIPQSRRLRQVDASRPLTVGHLVELVDEMVTASADMDAILRLMFRQALGGDQAAIAFRRRTMDAWRRDVRAHFATALSPDEADLNTDLLTMLVTGITFRAQVKYRADYPEFARTDGFRREVCSAVLASLPFCREQR